MYRKYIQAVEPLDDHILLIDFTSGSRLLLDMKPHLDSIRFRSLKRPEVWKSAETNGVFVRFGSVELSRPVAVTVIWNRVRTRPSGSMAFKSPSA